MMPHKNSSLNESVQVSAIMFTSYARFYKFKFYFDCQLKFLLLYTINYMTYQYYEIAKINLFSTNRSRLICYVFRLKLIILVCGLRRYYINQK